jgi:hypothetical protein
MYILYIVCTIILFSTHTIPTGTKAAVDATREDRITAVFMV